jgi:hypothetical protein
MPLGFSPREIFGAGFDQRGEDSSSVLTLKIR